MNTETSAELARRLRFIVADCFNLGVNEQTVDLSVIRAAADALLSSHGAMVPALEVFRIAGGDVECEPHPTAESALACLRDLRQCYDESLSSHGGGGEAVAWLIEFMNPPMGRAMWWCGRDPRGPYEFNACWTEDANKAIRFSRREDARQALVAFGLNEPAHMATEHAWITGITPPPQPRAEGMVLVPREPTEAMKDAAARHYGYSGYVALWDAMLAAAPAAPGAAELIGALRQIRAEASNNAHTESGQCIVALADEALARATQEQQG